MRTVNDGIRFLLELTTLVAVGWYFWSLPSRLTTKLLLAISVPVCIAIVWAVWISANSDTVVNDPWRLLLEVAVFGSGTVALFALKRKQWALVMAAAVALHLLATALLGQR